MPQRLPAPSGTRGRELGGGEGADIWADVTCCPCRSAGRREIPLNRSVWPAGPPGLCHRLPRGRCMMLMATADGGGFAPRGGTKFRGDVGCETPCTGRVGGYSFLAEVQLWPCALPGQFWTPVLRCGARGWAEEQDPAREAGGQPASRAGAVLLKAFPFVFEGFPGQKCSSDLCNQRSPQQTCRCRSQLPASSSAQPQQHPPLHRSPPSRGCCSPKTRCSRHFGEGREFLHPHLFLSVAHL